ncbi:hypothetical protein K9L16_02435 [Candidatus Pacearchaeota archaeon]|nr:hypothetical protein [Candidatus Pacearchaeota archaeon]
MPKFEIIQEKENPLFNRKEISGTIKTDITPNYKDVRKIISDKFSVPIETIKITFIKGKFGSKEFEIRANLYKSKEDFEATEKKSKKELEAEKQELAEVEAANAPKEAEKATEEPAEETETPEETSEQATQEDKVEDNKEEIKDSTEETEKQITKEEGKENA